MFRLQRCKFGIELCRTKLWWLTQFPPVVYRSLCNHLPILEYCTLSEDRDCFTLFSIGLELSRNLCNYALVSKSIISELLRCKIGHLNFSFPQNSSNLETKRVLKLSMDLIIPKISAEILQMLYLSHTYSCFKNNSCMNWDSVLRLILLFIPFTIIIVTVKIDHAMNRKLFSKEMTELPTQVILALWVNI